MTDLLIVALILLVWFGGMAFAAYTEWREWNGGICRETGEPWAMFGYSSQGCRGYKSGDYYIWVSYPVDRSRRHD